MPGQSVWWNLPIDIPEQDDIVHSCTGDVLAGRMQIQTHDWLFMAFEWSDEARILLRLHRVDLVFKFWLFSLFYKPC